MPRFKRFPILKEHGVGTKLSTMVSLPISVPEARPLIGQPAPDFALPDHTGAVHSLHAYLALRRPVVLFFFPLAGSPFCTKELCAFRDASASLPTFTTTSATIIGLSQDDAPRVRKFVHQHQIAYPVLSDVSRQVHEQWGIDTLFFGLLYKRSTFIIDSHGIVRGCAEGTMNYKGHLRYAESWLARLHSEDAFREQGQQPGIHPLVVDVRSDPPLAASEDAARGQTTAGLHHGVYRPGGAAAATTSTVDMPQSRAPQQALSADLLGARAPHTQPFPLRALQPAPPRTSPLSQVHPRLDHPLALVPEPPSYQNVDDLMSSDSSSAGYLAGLYGDMTPSTSVSTPRNGSERGNPNASQQTFINHASSSSSASTHSLHNAVVPTAFSAGANTPSQTNGSSGALSLQDENAPPASCPVLPSIPPVTSPQPARPDRPARSDARPRASEPAREPETGRSFTPERGLSALSPPLLPLTTSADRRESHYHNRSSYAPSFNNLRSPDGWSSTSQESIAISSRDDVSLVSHATVQHEQPMPHNPPRSSSSSSASASSSSHASHTNIRDTTGAPPSLPASSTGSHETVQNELSYLTSAFVTTDISDTAPSPHHSPSSTPSLSGPPTLQAGASATEREAPQTDSTSSPYTDIVSSDSTPASHLPTLPAQSGIHFAPLTSHASKPNTFVFPRGSTSANDCHDYHHLNDRTCSPDVHRDTSHETTTTILDRMDGLYGRRLRSARSEGHMGMGGRDVSPPPPLHLASPDLPVPCLQSSPPAGGGAGQLTPAPSTPNTICSTFRPEDFRSPRVHSRARASTTAQPSVGSGAVPLRGRTGSLARSVASPSPAVSLPPLAGIPSGAGGGQPVPAELAAGGQSLLPAQAQAHGQLKFAHSEPHLYPAAAAGAVGAGVRPADEDERGQQRPWH